MRYIFEKNSIPWVNALKNWHKHLTFCSQIQCKWLKNIEVGKLQTCSPSTHFSDFCGTLLTEDPHEGSLQSIPPSQTRLNHRKIKWPWKSHVMVQSWTHAGPAWEAGADAWTWTPSLTAARPLASHLGMHVCPFQQTEGHQEAAFSWRGQLCQGGPAGPHYWPPLSTGSLPDPQCMPETTDGTQPRFNSDSSYTYMPVIKCSW